MKNTGVGLIRKMFVFSGILAAFVVSMVLFLQGMASAGTIPQISAGGFHSAATPQPKL